MILYSDELLKEYNTVIQRDKFKTLVSPQQVNRFLILTIGALRKIKITHSIKKSRDPKDNYLLSMAVAGDAHYLITGDIHLLELKSIEKTVILTLSQFDTI
jgi:uncharacterized protein